MKLHELQEAYDKEAGSKYRGIDKDIVNWIRNEEKIHWNELQTNEAREKYGNIDVQDVYRGLKINDPELLHKLENPQGQTLHMHFDSATPDYHEAESFAMYVKSYNEMTMMYGLKSALKKGSAGQYGTAVVKLKPTKEQVIVKTYKTDDELKSNPKWKLPPGGLERELILLGDIEIESVKIFYPLTRETWQETLLNQIHTVKDLKNDFNERWIREVKIPEQELQEFALKLFPRILKSETDVVELLQCFTFIPKSVVYECPAVQKFIKKNINKANGQVIFQNKKIHIPMDVLKKFLTAKDLVQSLIQALNDCTFRPGKRHFDCNDELYHVMNVLRMYPNLVRKVQDHPIFKEVQSYLNPIFDQILTTNETNVKDEYSYMDIIYAATDGAQELWIFDPKIETKLKQIIHHIVHGFVKSGQLTQEKQRAIEIQRRVIQNSLHRFLDVIQAIHQKYN